MQYSVDNGEMIAYSRHWNCILEIKQKTEFKSNCLFQYN